MPNLNTFRAETKLKSRLGIAALLIVPLFIALLALAKFSEPTAPLALEHAQLARHVATGDGFATSVLRPLPLALQPHAAPVPDLVNAPVHSFLLAGVFAATGPSGRAAAALGLGFWLLLVWLVFGIARYWWDGRAAGLATVFFVCSLAGLQTATAGLPQPVMAILIFGAVAAIFPKPSNTKDGDFSLALWQPALAGALCGAAALTDYRLLPVALVLGFYLHITQQRRALVLTLFVAGLLLVLAPWCIRNWQASGRAFGFYWYNALENTRQFPGETIWRLTEAPKHPLLYLVTHPLDLGRKLIFGLAQYQRTGMGLLEPVTLFLCIVALFGAPAKSSRRRLVGIAISSVLLCTLLSCVTRPDAQLLLAWTPLLACVAAAQLANWVQATVEGFSTANARLRLSSMGMRSLTYTGIIALVAFPMLMHFGRTYANRRADIDTGINQRLPAGGAVLTDVPAYAAWYWKRPALLLCQREADLLELEKQTGKIAGVYLSPAITQFPQAELGDWWIWLTTPRGVYRGLMVTANSQLPGLLRLPQEAKVQMAGELELNQLEESQKSQHEDPQSSEAQTRLAFAYLKLNRLRDAQQIFQEVTRLDHDNIDALIGLWQTIAQLRHSDGTLRLALLAAQGTPRDPRVKPLLEEAAAHFEQVRLQRPGDPWLLLNLAGCRARLGQWKEMEACYAQLTQVLPKTFPARLVLANLYLQQDETAKAAAECAQLLREHSNMPAVHQMAGRVALAQNNLPEALKEFEATERLRPQWIEAHVQAGQICYRLQRHDNAAKHLQAALKLSPNSVNIKLNLADIYLAQEKNAAAIGLYREVLAVEAEQPIALNNLAALLAKTGQAAEALPFARQVVSRYPQNPQFRDTAGWIAFLTGNQNEALLHLWEAVRLAPNQGRSHFHLGKVLNAQGKSAEARQAFKRALECGLPADEQREAEAAPAGH